MECLAPLSSVPLAAFPFFFLPLVGGSLLGGPFFHMAVATRVFSSFEKFFFRVLPRYLHTPPFPPHALCLAGSV